MKTFITKLTAFSTLALVAGLAGAQGIKDTPHNLGSAGTGDNRITGTATAEICVFCHTPHGADTTAPAPLWNKRLPTGTSYTTYESLNSSTMNARFATDGTGTASIGSVSIACLSCHDGAQAMDNVINAPGSGGFAADGGGDDGRTGAGVWDWTGTRSSAEGRLTGIANLGTDLSNDHPIGIEYCGGGPTVLAAGTACNDKDFVTPTSGTLGGATVFWVNTTVTGSTADREKTDMVLYNRAFGTDTAPSVECASCHDPHVAAKNTNEVAFLRVSQASSGVCLACHVK